MAVGWAVEAKEARNGLDAYDSETERLTSENLAAEAVVVAQKQDIENLTIEKQEASDNASFLAMRVRELEQQRDDLIRDKEAAEAKVTELEVAITHTANLADIEAIVLKVQADNKKVRLNYASQVKQFVDALLKVLRSGEIVSPGEVANPDDIVQPSLFPDFEPK